MFRQLEEIGDPRARKLVYCGAAGVGGTIGQDAAPGGSALGTDGVRSRSGAGLEAGPGEGRGFGDRGEGIAGGAGRGAAATSFAFDESPAVKVASPRRARARATKGSPLLWAGIGGGAGLLIVGIVLALVLGGKVGKDGKEVADARAGDASSKPTGNDPRRSDAGKDNKKDPKDRPKEVTKDNGKDPTRDPGKDPMTDPGRKDPKPEDKPSDPNRFPTQPSGTDNPRTEDASRSLFTGTFTTDVNGYTETWSIKFADDKWDISAIYTKSGEKDCGSFKAEDINFKDGKLTFIQRLRLGPNSPGFWRTGSAITVEVKDENSLTYVWRQGIGDEGRPRILVKSSSTAALPKDPVPSTPDDPALATVQQREDAVANLKDLFQTAIKKAENDLVAALEQEINLPNTKLAPEMRKALVALRREEKEAFQKSGKLPWSPAMRPAVIKYLQARAAADRQLAATYDKVYDQTVKSGDQKRAVELTAEKNKLLEPKLVATLDCNGVSFGAHFTYRLYSNGKLSLDANNPSTWEFTETNKIVLTAFRADAPNGRFIDTCTIDSDGKTLKATNQSGQTYGAKIN